MQPCPQDIKSSGPMQMATLTRHFTQRCKLKSASSSAGLDGSGHEIKMWAKASEMAPLKAKRKHAQCLIFPPDSIYEV